MTRPILSKCKLSLISLSPNPHEKNCQIAHTVNRILFTQLLLWCSVFFDEMLLKTAHQCDFKVQGFLGAKANISSIRWTVAVLLGR